MSSGISRRVKTPPQYQIIYGDAAAMDVLRDGEVDLIVTGPPYFAGATEVELKKKHLSAASLEQVRKDLVAFALSLRPVFSEMARVLKPDGVIVIQTSDIRCGPGLVGVAGVHRQIMEALGFQLVTRVFRHMFSKHSPALRFRRDPEVGTFRMDDVEEVQVYSHGKVPRRAGRRVDLEEREIEKSCSPLWAVAPAGARKIHPHQSPEALVRRMIAFYSLPGDLVVDPFCGSGTTLRLAMRMGRRAIGYEVVWTYVERADSALLVSAAQRGPRR